MSVWLLISDIGLTPQCELIIIKIIESVPHFDDVIWKL